MPPRYHACIDDGFCHGICHQLHVCTGPCSYSFLISSKHLSSLSNPKSVWLTQDFKRKALDEKCPPMPFFCAALPSEELPPTAAKWAALWAKVLAWTQQVLSPQLAAGKRQLYWIAVLLCCKRGAGMMYSLASKSRHTSKSRRARREGLARMHAYRCPQTQVCL